MPVPTAVWSLSAVDMSSSTLIDSISNARRIWAQPARSVWTTLSWSATASKWVFTACGCVITSLSASAVAKILTRIRSIMGRALVARLEVRHFGNAEYSYPILTKRTGGAERRDQFFTDPGGGAAEPLAATVRTPYP